MSKLRILGVSGHRQHRDQNVIKEAANNVVENAKKNKYLAISCGGCSYSDYQTREKGGFDYYIMRACVAQSVPLILRLPFPSFYVGNRYTTFAHNTSGVVTYNMNKPNEKWHFRKALLDRNTEIVNDSFRLAIFWDGRKTGGTLDTMKKAREKKLPVTNYFPSPLLTLIDGVRRKDNKENVLDFQNTER